jgi:hypothetical protein
MGLPFSALSRSSYVPPDGGSSTLLGGDPNVVRVVDPSSARPAAPQRTAVARNLPGVGETYLDSEFAPKIDSFMQSVRDRGVNMEFESAYRSPIYREYMIAHPKETGTVYPPNFSDRVRELHDSRMTSAL